MKAIKLFGKEDLRLVETPVPQISDKQILLKVEAAGICGTDIKNWKHGRVGVDESHPLTLGHEVAGRIAEVGKDVPFYRKGMQVTIAPNMGCAICDQCVSGNTHNCAELKAFGINMDGAFAEYMAVPEEAIAQGNIMVLPEGVSPVEAAVNEPLSCVYDGFLKCRVQPGDNAVVIGAGAIGILHAMLLKMAGVAKIIMNDISEQRLEDAKQIIPELLTYCGDDLRGFVMAETGGKGADVAITANPVPQCQQEALELMNYNGRVNFFGLIPAEMEPVPINTNLIHSKALIVTGNSRSSVSEFRKTMEFVAAGLIPVKRVVTDQYAIEDGLRAFERARQARGLKHVIVFPD